MKRFTNIVVFAISVLISSTSYSQMILGTEKPDPARLSERNTFTIRGSDLDGAISIRGGGCSDVRLDAGDSTFQTFSCFLASDGTGSSTQTVEVFLTSTGALFAFIQLNVVDGAPSVTNVQPQIFEFDDILEYTVSGSGIANNITISENACPGASIPPQLPPVNPNLVTFICGPIDGPVSGIAEILDSRTGAVLFPFNFEIRSEDTGGGSDGGDPDGGDPDSGGNPEPVGESIDIVFRNTDFGFLSPSQCGTCSVDREVRLRNKSDFPVRIDNINLTNLDGTFEILRVEGRNYTGFDDAVTITPRTSVVIEVRLITDDVSLFDAFSSVLSVDATNEQTGETKSLTQQLSAGSISETLSVRLADANSIVDRVNAVGQFFKNDGLSLTLQDLDDQFDELPERKGLVSDGNARLIVQVKSSRISGKVRLSFPTNGSQMSLDLFNSSPTYVNDLDNTYSSPNKELEIDLIEGIGYAVIRAGELFPGMPNVSQNIQVLEVCVLSENGDSCDLTLPQEVFEKRAPAVLIHGLWASASSFGYDIDGSDNPGLYSALRRSGKRSVEVFQYYSSFSPDQVMNSSNTLLFRKINNACDSDRSQGFACTRSDLIGHSMGGLVARKYISDNDSHRSAANFYQGSVRRLVPIGTPHFGSELADLLLLNKDVVGSCLRKRSIVDPQTQLILTTTGIVSSEVIRVLGVDGEITAEEIEAGYRVTENGETFINAAVLAMAKLNPPQLTLETGAIGYLSTSSLGLANLNSRILTVPSRAVIGDVALNNLTADLFSLNLGGEDFLSIFAPLVIGISGCNQRDLFNNQNSDGVVSIESAGARGRFGNSIDTTNALHLGMGTNENIIELVVFMLDSPLTDFSPTL